MCQGVVGEWNFYQGYTSYRQMEYFHDRLFVLSSGGSVFSYHVGTEEMTEHSRLNGLSGSKVQFLVSSPATDQLVFVFSDGNMDFMNADGSIYNLPDLKNKSLMGDKTLYGVHLQADRLYIAAGFGFITVDVARREIAESYLFGRQCDKIFLYGDRIYMSDTEGLHYCLSGLNAYDKSNWVTCNSLRVKDVAIFKQGDVSACWLLMTDGTVYTLAADGTMSRFTDKNYYLSLRKVNDYLFMQGNGLMVVDPADRSVSWNYQEPYNMTVDFVPAGDSSYYMLHQREGILAAKLIDRQPWGNVAFDVVWDEVAMNGIHAGTLCQLDYTHGLLAGIVSDPVTFFGGGVSPVDGMLSIHDETGWKNISLNTLSPRPAGTYAFKGLTSLAADPVVPGRYYVGSIYDGFYHLDGDSVLAHYDHTNSNIASLWVDRVSALLPDVEGNVWFANAGVSPILKCRTADGKWRQYPIAGFDGAGYVSRLMQAVNDPYRFKWMVAPKSGCALYYDGGTPGDLSDDDCASFSSLTDQDGNNIVPDFYNDLVEDKNGWIWLLTTSGPFVIESQIAAFNHPGSVRRIKVPRNDGTNLADYLLAGVNTYCMAVDVANRKWIGTKGNGLYLLSADGLEMIGHFTQENSPLPTNDILSLEMDDLTGTLFISVDGGVLTYRTDAVAGQRDFSNVYCWPNPVRPEYIGEVHVSGLMDNTEVRITDINNNLIYAATSAGGMITWNLCNASGRRVKSGVYLIYGCSEDGKEGMVTKLMVVR